MREYCPGIHQSPKIIWVSAALLAVMLCGVAAVVCGVFGWELTNTVSVPFGDMYHAIERLNLYADGKMSMMSLLFTPGNEHILFTSYVFFLADWFLASGRGLIPVLGSNLLAMGMATILAAAAIRARPELPLTVRAAGSLFFFLIWLNANQLLNLTWAYQIQHWLSAAFGLAAALLAGRMIENEFPERRARYLIILAVIGIAAILTLANGVVVLPAVAAIMFLSRRWKLGFAILALGMVGGAIYMKIAGGKAPSGVNFASLDTYWHIAKFTVLFVGGLFSREGVWPGNLAFYSRDVILPYSFGCLLLAIAAYGAVKRLRDARYGGAMMSAGLALLLIVIATGLLGSLARMPQGAWEALNKKYATVGGLGWCGAVLILLASLPAAPIKTVRVKHMLFIGIGAALSLWVLGTHGREFVLWEKWNKRLEESATAVQFHSGDREYYNTLFFDLKSLQDLSFNFLQPHRASYFNVRPAFGSLVSMPAGLPQCVGSLDSVTPVPDRLSDAVHAFRIQGWAMLPDAKLIPKYVLALDESNHVRGLASFTRPAQIVDEVVFAQVSKLHDYGFFGFFNPGQSGKFRLVVTNVEIKPGCLLAEIGM